jgi:hypothetical protein
VPMPGYEVQVSFMVNDTSIWFYATDPTGPTQIILSLQSFLLYTMKFCGFEY